MNVLFIAPVGLNTSTKNFEAVHGGYGNATYNTLKILHFLKQKNELDFLSVIDISQQKISEEVINSLLGKYDVCICVTSPVSLVQDENYYNFIKMYMMLAEKRYLQVVWETEGFPESFDKLFKDDFFTGFLAPSYWGCKELSKKTDKPIFYYPHFVDSNNFNLINIERKKDEKKFTVLYIGQYTQRKGISDAVIAFTRTFAQNPNCELIIKISKMSNTEVQPEIYLKSLIHLNTKILSSSIKFIDDNLSNEQLGDIYETASVLLFSSRGEGFGLPCHPKNTQILLSTGYKFIQDIKKNDKVLSHTGNYRNVIDITKTKYKGILYNIKPRGSFSIEATQKHKFYVVKTNKRFSLLNEKNLKPKWVEIENIKKEDLITVPKIKIKNEIKYLYVDDYIKNLSYDGDYVYSKKSFKTNGEFSLKTIAKKFGCTFQTVHKALNYQRNSQLMEDIRNYCNEINYKIPEYLKIRNKIELTEEVMRFFGLFLAEGSFLSNMGGLEFSFHSNEFDLQECIKKVGNYLIPNSEITIKKRKNRCSITITSSIIAQFFFILFNKGAKNKSIPFSIFNSKNTGYLLRGYFEGDGSLKNKNISLTTISLSLALWTIKLLNKHSIYGSIRKYKSKKFNKNDIYVIHIYYQFFNKFNKITGLNILKKINKTKRENNFILEDKNYFYVPIKNISNNNFEGTVYNMHVEDDESYLVNGFSSHNCAEAMLQGLPVIYTNWSALREVGRSDYNHTIDYTIDDAHSMTIYGYESGLKYAVPKISDIINKLSLLYNEWEKDKEQYYNKYKNNRKVIEDRYGVQASEKVILNILHDGKKYEKQEEFIGFKYKSEFLDLNKSAEVIIDEQNLNWIIRQESIYDDILQDEIGANINHEKEILNEIIKLSSKYKNFIDIGAHVGYYTVRLSKYFKSIYAVEPNVKNYQGLCINIILNKLTNIKAIPEILYSEEKNIKLIDYGSSSFISENDSGNSYELKSKTFDSLFKNENNCIIKIDVEGSEIEVLKGAIEFLKGNNIFVIEWHKDLRNDVVDFMKNHDYKIFKEFGHIKKFIFEKV